MEDVDKLLGEALGNARPTAGWINGGNLHQKEERSIIASAIALHGVKVCLLISSSVIRSDILESCCQN